MITVDSQDLLFFAGQFNIFIGFIIIFYDEDALIIFFYYYYFARVYYLYSSKQTSLASPLSI